MCGLTKTRKRIGEVRVLERAFMLTEDSSVAAFVALARLMERKLFRSRSRKWMSPGRARIG